MKKILTMSFIFLFALTFSSMAIDLTLEELAKYNGKDKKEIYVAVDGVIYDVTNVKAWNGQGKPHDGKKPEKGVHHGNVAGKDLTKEIDTLSPHGRKVLAKLTPVGKVIQ